MSDCVFCQRIACEEYVPCNRAVVRFAPLNPVTPGHMLFVPLGHLPSASTLAPVTGDVFCEAARYAATRPDDFNLITSAGADATQTVQHLHVHYVPRRAGDGLTLPWTGQVRAG
jgi:histidine triad (HIT) family protein